MKKTELSEKGYISPEIYEESVAIEDGFAASTMDLEEDPDSVMWL